MTKQEIETWINKLADGLLNGPNELTYTVTERMFRHLDGEQVEAIRSHVVEHRKAAAKQAKAETEVPTEVPEVPSAEPKAKK